MPDGGAANTSISEAIGISIGSEKLFRSNQQPSSRLSKQTSKHHTEGCNDAYVHTRTLAHAASHVILVPASHVITEPRHCRRLSKYRNDPCLHVSATAHLQKEESSSVHSAHYMSLVNRGHAPKATLLVIKDLIRSPPPRPVLSLWTVLVLHRVQDVKSALKFTERGGRGLDCCQLGWRGAFCCFATPQPEGNLLCCYQSRRTAESGRLPRASQTKTLSLVYK